jgi:GH25 family lysozyme M1 (1,4-beta-N-acetylmuramidase)
MMLNDKVREKVTIMHKTCGHEADRVIIYEYQNMRQRQDKINFYSKRIKCPSCDNKR